MKDALQQKLQEIVKKLTNKHINIQLSIPKDISKGDFTTTVAFQLSKLLHQSPLEVAEKIVSEFGNYAGIEYIEPASPGFINFYLSNEFLSRNLLQVLRDKEKVAVTTKMVGKKIMVEFAHPNTHKEMHIGHMRTLTTGESLARLLTANGATVFRANYQGDIGPHVAKAIYGITKMMQEQGLILKDVQQWEFAKKAHFLGQGYARGSKEYEEGAKEEIDALNSALYKRDPRYREMYQTTRQWSLDYYGVFYKRFYTTFDKLFFEGDLDKEAVAIVFRHVGDVFTRDSDGSIIFQGEKYGLHTRVFITQKGTPTYEGKEVALGFAEHAAFPFDLKIHVVASEQTGYFQVVFKALELIDPKIFAGHEYHLPMGMVQLVGRKMSSRTGDVLTVDELLDKVKEAALAEFSNKALSKEEKEKVLEQVTIGAIKYAILKGGVTQNAVFDIEKSVSLNGNSGPYVQYAYTRTQSILEKAHSVILPDRQSGSGQAGSSCSGDVSPSKSMQKDFIASLRNGTLYKDYTPSEEEKVLMRELFQFPEVIANAALAYAPNVVCEYVFELSQLFNNFYQKYRILQAPLEQDKKFRLALTMGVGIILKQGLALLGIEAPNKM